MVEEDTATETETGLLGGKEMATMDTEDEVGSTEAGTAKEEADGAKTEEVAGMEIGITTGVAEEVTQIATLSLEEESAEVIVAEASTTIEVILGEIKMITEATEVEAGIATETEIETITMVLIDTEVASVTTMMIVEVVGIVAEAEEAVIRKTTTESKTVDGEMTDQEEMVGVTSMGEAEATIKIEMKEALEVDTTAATVPEVETLEMTTGLEEERRMIGQKAKMMAGVKKKKTKPLKKNLTKKLPKNNPDKQDI